MGSSTKAAHKILGTVTAATAEEFLHALANLWDDPKACGKLLSKYPGVFHPSTTETAVFAYRNELRRAWDAPDQRYRDWYIYSLRRAHALLERSLALRENDLHIFEETLQRRHLANPGADLSGDPFTEPPPAVTPFEAVLWYFQTRIGDRAKHCGHVDCRVPYFIAKKRWQKFCSEECAGPANRESKRKWWADNRAVRS